MIESSFDPAALTMRENIKHRIALLAYKIVKKVEDHDVALVNEVVTSMKLVSYRVIFHFPEKERIWF